jgi:ribonuclease E
MQPPRHHREVENRLRDALKMDRARVQIGRISRFGLLEMSRQRLRPSLGESSQIVCPRCTGQGTIRGVESLSLSVLRIIEEEAMKENTVRVVARVPVDVGTYLLNEKRELLHGLESRHRVSVMLIPSPAMETPNYEIQRIRTDELRGGGGERSYHMTRVEAELEEAPITAQTRTAVEAPAVKTVAPTAPAPEHKTVAEKPDARKPGVLRRLFTTLFGAGEKPRTTEKKPGERRRGQQRGQGKGSPDGGPQRGRQAQRRTRPGDDRQPAGRSARRDRPRQANRPQKKTPRNEAEKPSLPADQDKGPETGTAQAERTQQGQGRGSRRGRRGGRRRPSGQRRSEEGQKETAANDSGQPSKTEPPVNSQAKTPASTETAARQAPVVTDAGNKREAGKAPATAASPGSAQPKTSEKVIPKALDNKPGASPAAGEPPVQKEKVIPD